jgi:hypothetical protein
MHYALQYAIYTLLVQAIHREKDLPNSWLNSGIGSGKPKPDVSRRGPRRDYVAHLGTKGTLGQIISHGLERVKHNENNPFTFRLYT